LTLSVWGMEVCASECKADGDKSTNRHKRPI
jgi:hypothetical protein